MTFVREKISKEDFEKYRIAHFDERIPNALRPGSTWTIDRERNIYLIHIGGGGREPEETNVERFIFSFEAYVFTVNMSYALSKINEKHWIIEWHVNFWNFISYFSSGRDVSENYSKPRPFLEDAIRIFQFPGIDDAYDSQIDVVFSY